MNRFNEKTDSITPKVTEKEAADTAEELLNELKESIKEVSLCYIRPDFILTKESKTKESERIKLAYKLTIDNEIGIIYIDAISGELIGIDINQSECSGSYGQTNSGLSHSGDRVDLAGDGFVSLGYSPNYYKKLDTTDLKTYVENHMNRSNAYALYFCGHGSDSTTNPRISVKKKDDYYAVLYKDDVKGNWHFVFLDACHTGRSIWSEAFNITSSHTDRAYLGWDGTVLASNSYEFAKKFWPLMGTMSIRDAAVKASNEVPGSGTTPIRFFGDSSYYGAPH